MIVAVFSDVHDNIARLEEVLKICGKKKIETCICCGDIGTFETFKKIYESFRNVYFALGNADYTMLNKTGLLPESVTWDKEIVETELNGKKVAVVHHDYKARKLAETGEFDIIFYGHTHTPWEKKIGKSLLINPGEIAGHYGRASFALFDTETLKAELIILD